MFFDDRLDARKRKILKAIIDDYIDTAEPVGSRTLSRKHDLGFSSATIRNEMADLEELGYLTQPHTSAGRVPSDTGYRLYVDQLMKANTLSRKEIESIRNALEISINEMSQLIRQASLVMSRITKYTSMAITPQMKKSVLKAVQVVPIEPGKCLVIVVTNAGTVRNCLVNITKDVSADNLIRISNIFNEKLDGLTIQQINLPVIKDIQSEIGVTEEVLLPILNAVADCINQIDNLEVYLDGAKNIFNYPEFRDLIKAKEFLDILDEKEVLHKMLRTSDQNPVISIKIGKENDVEEIKDCSLVTASYSLGDLVLGTIGIIGPTRMEYARVISSMNYIRNKINEEIRKLIGENFNGTPWD